MNWLFGACGMGLAGLLLCGCPNKGVPGPDGTTPDATVDAPVVDAGVYDPVQGNAFLGPLDLSDSRVQGLEPTVLLAGSDPCMEPVLARVISVTDGDTVEVMGISMPLRTDVRFIGVDTPEIGRMGRADECYAQAASSFTAQLEDRVVWLTFDTECRDNFDRLLAYVHVGGGLGDVWQRQLLRRGLASVLRIPPNVAFSAQFNQDEEAAQQGDIGQWGVCR